MTGRDRMPGDVFAWELARALLGQSTWRLRRRERRMGHGAHHNPITLAPSAASGHR